MSLKEQTELTTPTTAPTHPIMLAAKDSLAASLGSLVHRAAMVNAEAVVQRTALEIAIVVTATAKGVAAPKVTTVTIAAKIETIALNIAPNIPSAFALRSASKRSFSACTCLEVASA